MIVLPTYSGETAIFGLGRSGLAAVAALCAAGNRVVAWDDAEAPRAIAAELGADIRDLTQDFGATERLIVSPGVPLTHPEPHGVIAAARAANAEIWGDMDLFANALAHGDLREAVTLIGITGTNGKSTTTALVTHMLETAGHKAHQGGNIGTPVLELPLEKGAAYVLELSSYQLDLNRRFGVDIGVWLNLTPDHLDRHGDMAGYAAAKAQLFADGKAAQARIVGIDDAHMRALADNLAQDGLPLMTLGAQNADLIYLANAFEDGSENISLADCPALSGAHNAQNAAAAFAVGQNIGLTQTQILAAFRSFGGMPHRLQMIADYQAIKFVNDSKATNVEATRHALAAFDNIYWIVGGRAKMDADGRSGLDMLNPHFGNVRGAYLIGEAAQAFASALADNMPITVSGTLDQAVADAAMQAKSDHLEAPVVLLSPACASFDQFEDFEARGDAFAAAAAHWITNDKAMALNAEGAR
ncbi:MAG TPA: UDP-N-acetylmuramoyl-L-alanine--D-glutamate ligase [Rhodobiaceae bacterium]|nr:UDP-N-acetylmuramoyl-L-alanine--D-glutamate ligase [Rhodobiaceae bacterium]|tara:strand:+ start:219 stop:1631 length:1413 start_codon:yes stop_codon:yes gene_type:complete